MYKSQNQPLVSVTLNLPIEVAEYLRDNGEELIRAFTFACKDFKNNPPPDIAEIQNRERAEKLRQISGKFARIGRNGYRLLRSQIQLETFVSSIGDVQIKKVHTGIKWNRICLSEIAIKQDLEREYLQFAISKHRRQFDNKLRARRVREALRYARHGLSDKEIGLKIGVHATTANRYVSEARGQKSMEGRK